MKKIVYLVPGLMPEAEAARRLGMMRGWADADTQLDIAVVEYGPASIESTYEELMAVPATARLAVEKEAEGYDAAIIGCAGDPGMDAIRELCSRMLITGPGMLSMQAACMLGHRFGILETDDSMEASTRELAFRAGCLEKLGSVESIGVPVLDLMAGTQREDNKHSIVAACRRAMKKGADVMVYGCMSMAFQDTTAEIEQEIGIPVVNPAKTALKFTEALLASGLTHSKRAYPLPVKVAEGKVESVLALVNSCEGGH